MNRFIHFQQFFLVTFFLGLAVACGKNNSDTPDCPIGPCFSNPLKAVIESQADHLSMISSLETTYSTEVAQAKLLPSGSAMITDSGNLKNSGITAIIHAVVGSLTQSGMHFSPSVDHLKASIKNSLTLAQRYGHSRVAITTEGSQSLAAQIGISQDQLLDAIVNSALESRSGLELTFVVAPGDYFSVELKTSYHAFASPSVQVRAGTIIGQKFHRSTAIVHPTTMEAKFGSGISADIADESFSSSEIESFAKAKISKFNQTLLNLSNEIKESTWEPHSQSTPKSAAALDQFPPKPVPAGRLDCSQLPFLCIPDDGSSSSGVPVYFGASKPILLSATSSNCSNFHTAAFPTDDAIKSYIVSLATPAPQEEVFYRWGEDRYESARVGITPPFDFKYLMNFGAAVGGKGMYVAKSPTDSASYGDDVVKAGKKVALITYRVPKGSPLLMMNDSRIKRSLKAAFSSNWDKVVFECNPPVQVGNYLGNWWVLKDNQGVVAEDFDGRDRPNPASDYSNLPRRLKQFYKNKCFSHWGCRSKFNNATTP